MDFQKEMVPATAAATGCPACGGDLCYMDGETVCTGCGLVVDEPLSREREYNAYDHDELTKRERVMADDPMKPSFTEMGYPLTKDHAGTPLGPEQVQWMYRLRWLNRRSQVPENRTMNLALGEIARVCNVLGLPTAVVHTAANAFRRCHERGLVRGRTTEFIVAGTIKYGCRKCGVPRETARIAREFQLKRGNVSKAYRLIVAGLEERMPLPDPLTYASQILAKLNLRNGIPTITARIIDAAKEARITVGKSPKSIAAAAIWLACREAGNHYTQRDVAEAAGTSEVTLRNRFKELTERLKNEGFRMDPR